jgi:ABC-2 type transport system permease protein
VKMLLRAMPAFMRASLATMVQYRGELVLWAIWGVVYPAVAMAMWSAAVKGSASGQAIGGMRPEDFAAYFLLTMIVGHATAAWDIFEMGYLVRTGAMSPRLLQPLLPVWQSLADNLAYKLVTLVILAPIWIGVIWVAHPHFQTTPFDLALGIPAILLAAALHYLWGYNVALGAFWMTRMDAVSELWWVLNLGLGGRMAPLPIMPAPVQWLAALLPFKWIVWFPAAALAGQLPREEVIAGLVWQVAWLAAGLVAFRLIWRAAVRRYSAVGA